MRGLAFKEIGGAFTEIDVYPGPLDPEGAAGWKQVASYRQPLCNGAHNVVFARTLLANRSQRITRNL